MNNSGNSSSSSSSGGIGFVGLLTILFIALKLTGHVEWSWIWVLSPLWISALLAIVLIGGLFAMIAREDRKRGF